MGSVVPVFDFYFLLHYSFIVNDVMMEEKKIRHIYTVGEDSLIRFSKKIRIKSDIIYLLYVEASRGEIGN